MTKNTVKIVLPNETVIFAPCAEFDETNYEVILDIELKRADRDQLLSKITPGAISELYNILGEPRFIDTTYSSGNTLWIYPLSGTGLYSLRGPLKVGVRRYTENMVRWDLFKIRLECVRL